MIKDIELGHCTKLAEWELREADPYMASYCCTEHLSANVAAATIEIGQYSGSEPCCHTGIRYDTIDGKWWLFKDDKPQRELTDEEAASVIWDKE